MGILITGTGHMIVGRIVRGVLILIGAVAVVYVAGLIGGLVLIAICAVIYWVLQLVDVYKQIHRMKGVVKA
jgi:TM2 domain-containing membrane protein YozV